MALLHTLRFQNQMLPFSSAECSTATSFSLPSLRFSFTCKYFCCILWRKKHVVERRKCFYIACKNTLQLIFNVPLVGKETERGKATPSTECREFCSCFISFCGLRLDLLIVRKLIVLHQNAFNRNEK